VKGGSGTSVVAALLAIAAAQVEPTVLVDADGDQPAIFGVASGTTGFRDWWQARVEVDALERLAIDISSTLRLIPSGTSMPDAQRDFRGIDDALTIVDAGTIRENDFAAQIVESSAKSLLVLRPCYLAARRASLSDLRIDGMVVVEEQGRSLRSKDLADVVGAPVVAMIPWDLSIARTIDAGRLANRVPRAARVVEDLAKDLRRVG
jgi:MinD superfamily P-loop ATPase